MSNKLLSVLQKIDYKISSEAFSRPQYQVKLLVERLLSINRKKVNSLLDVGGGFDAQYKSMLMKLARSYTNMEIDSGEAVDVVGTIYSIPFPKSKFDIVTSFMVMEHLNRPMEGMIECNRVLKKKGYLLLTTVQYWHTHNYPSDYFRYTRNGLEYLCQESGFKVIKIWSHGGPFLVLFHVIEINLTGIPRALFSILFYRLANFLDYYFFRHYDKRKNSDSVGWSLIAQKI